MALVLSTGVSASVGEIVAPEISSSEGVGASVVDAGALRLQPARASAPLHLIGGHNSSPEARGRWVASVYGGAGEAVLARAGPRGSPGFPPDGGFPGAAAAGGGLDPPEDHAARAARRAKGRLRRFVRHHRLERMLSLTCRDQTRDRALMVRRVGRFMRRCRRLYGAQPYVVVLERHKSGAWHAHVAVRGFRRHGAVSALWGYGFVFVTAPPRPERYLGKYLGKTLDVSQAGAHRYEVAQGFPPTVDRIEAWGADEAWRQAVAYMGGELPEYEWHSSTVEDWRGPPTTFLSWDITPARPPSRARSGEANP